VTEYRQLRQFVIPRELGAEFLPIQHYENRIGVPGVMRRRSMLGRDQSNPYSCGGLSTRTHGKTVDRRDWRVLVSFHLAESKQQAEREAVDGLWWWHNEYTVRVLARPGAVRVEDKQALLAQVNGGGSGVGSAVMGTPDELVTMIRGLQQVTGGFGDLLGFRA
jgi:hypothetical protein